MKVDTRPTVPDKVIAQAPHFSIIGGMQTADPAFQVNHEKVWDIVPARITRTQNCWTYVKPA